MLTRNHRQEALCRAYVQAVAARGGMSCSVPSPDYGIDLTLNDIEPMGAGLAESGYKLDIQAKSTTRAAVAKEAIRFDLPVQGYEVLRQASVGCPRLLVVLVLPDEEAHWTSQTEDALILRHCAYWLSLRGRRRTSNRRSIRVSLPRSNVFSVEALRGLLIRIKRGEQL